MYFEETSLSIKSVKGTITDSRLVRCTSCVAPMIRESPPPTTNSKKHKNVERYVSTAKLIIASMMVSERIRASRAASIDPLTASIIWLFVAKAMKRGMLAAEDAACCAARQPVRRSPLALLMAVCAESEDISRRNAMKMRDRMGYASHVRERM